MKQFDIPNHYDSLYIKQVKNIRSKADKLKKDLSPSQLNFNHSTFFLARHFGFCYGVQNAVEIVYKTIEENPSKNIYLLSEIIHNPEVNQDLKSKGLKFIQDTNGNQLISWDTISKDDIVLIPAFGTTLEIEQILKEKQLNYKPYDTTCPFVEKVWNKAEKLAKEGYTIVVHGNFSHEETRATFSHAAKHGPVIVVSNFRNAQMMSDFMFAPRADDRDWNVFFRPVSSKGFNFRKDFDRIAVVNQTTMLASETQEISDYLKEVMISKFGESHIKEHFGSTRDTLCYATNDNQGASIELSQTELDLAIVIGGENSSNTKHLVEVLEKKCPTYFISSEKDLTDHKNIIHYDHVKKEKRNVYGYLPKRDHLKIGITSGASCPDAMFEKVFLKVLSFVEEHPDIDAAIQQLDQEINGF
jgi:4-hydroxy-3-methylbut-2-enyl diphosphate reductase